MASAWKAAVVTPRPYKRTVIFAKRSGPSWYGSALPMVDEAPSSGACRRSRVTRRVSPSVTSSFQPLEMLEDLALCGIRPASTKASPPSVSTSPSHRPEPRVHRLGDVVELGARVGVPDALVKQGQQAGQLLVMLVLDLADDLLDHVLDGQQALGAAELVDDDGEVDAPARIRASRSSTPIDSGT